jgi:hypothetical protein
LFISRSRAPSARAEMLAYTAVRRDDAGVFVHLDSIGR